MCSGVHRSQHTPQGAGGVGGILSVTDHEKQTPLTSYPCYDGNGNITEYLSEENGGTLAAHYQYDTFGNVIKKTGEKEYEYQFSTKPYDTLTGLNYYNYRDYDPVSGRWINRDPIEENGGMNLYVFNHNSSLVNYDYFGLSSSIPCSDVSHIGKIRVESGTVKVTTIAAGIGYSNNFSEGLINAFYEGVLSFSKNTLSSILKASAGGPSTVGLAAAMPDRAYISTTISCCQCEANEKTPKWSSGKQYSQDDDVRANGAFNRKTDKWEITWTGPDALKTMAESIGKEASEDCQGNNFK